ncbi:head maturation protease, ClpP-related [Streptosporangium sp. NPDC020145]|uniref:head maturation protease, ClpP-related n=1 Tax=Streptosporangium sp. NPDC020145 TaxID=3154694 RepID=UPI00343645CA
MKRNAPLPASNCGRKAQMTRTARGWYRVANQHQADTVDIYIYDEISAEGITAKDFTRDLRGITASNIELHLNTQGGDVYDGMTIYNALRRHRAHVTVIVDGLAASIGSVIAMAGDRIIMAPHSQMMIHEAWVRSVGDADETRKTADLLDKMSDNIAQVYANKAGGSVVHWRSLMKAETWFTAEEAVEAGLAGEVADRLPVAARLREPQSVLHDRDFAAIFDDAMAVAAATYYERNAR